MNKQTFGNMIATMRKERGMTQLELAEIFDVTVDALMQTKKETKENESGNKCSNYHVRIRACMHGSYTVT